MARCTCSKSSSGFSLVEVMIATALLGTSLVAVAQLFATATKANTNARASTFANVLAQQKMEQLRGLIWGFNTQNNPVSDHQTNLAVTPPAANGGPGLSPSPSDTLIRSTVGYVDYLDSAGTWLGTATLPVAGAVYIRRWSVTPLSQDPNNTLVLQVTVARLRGHAAAIAAARLTDEARLMSIKTRKYQ